MKREMAEVRVSTYRQNDQEFADMFLYVKGYLEAWEFEVPYCSQFYRDILFFWRLNLVREFERENGKEKECISGQSAPSAAQAGADR